MSKARPDFATIRLSDAGKRLAGEHGVIRWANSRRHFAFKAGESQEVERSFEWNHLLRHELFQGAPILEEIEEAEEESGSAELDESAPAVETMSETTVASEPAGGKPRKRI
jgi:hypothetical protein